MGEGAMSAPRSVFVAIDAARHPTSLTEARQMRALLAILRDSNHPLHLQLVGIADVAIGMDRVGPPDGGAA
jgi:hypothetical protein